MIRFAFLGLGLGAIYALIGQGMILVYRGSGVLNFAQGSTAAIGAVAYYELHRAGLPLWLAAIGAIVLCAAVGLMLHLCVMRPLRKAPPLARLIATLGIMTLILQILDIWLGSSVRTVPSLLPTGSVSPLQGTAVGEDRFILLGIAIAVSLSLWTAYRYTFFGVLTTSVAENETVAQLGGHSPDRIAASNWMLGTALAGAAGIFIAPIAGLTVDTLTLLIIPALATGLAAGFQSFPIALGASLVLGITQSEMTRYISTPGWSDAAPFLLVIVVLIIRGRALPLRSHINQVLPRLGSGILRPRLLLPGVAAMSAILLITPSTWTDALTTSLIGGTICLSLVIVTGYAGQLSLAQFAFAGWAAYIAGRLGDLAGVPFLAALAIGVLAAVPVGLVVGLPALRTRGINLAIATFGLAYAFQTVLFNNTGYTGGVEGTVVKPASIVGWDVDSVNHPKRYAFVCLVGLLVTAIIAGNVRRGRSGRRLLAVRGNERAAAALGIGVPGAKLYAFALSAAIAGLAGGLLAFRSTYVDYTQFDVFGSISVVIFTVIGGVGYIVGAIIGGLSFGGGTTYRIVSTVFHSGHTIEYVTLVLSAFLVPTLISYPNGLAAGRLKTSSEPGIADRVAQRLSSALLFRTQPGRTGDIQRGAEVSFAHVVPRHLVVEDASVRFGGVQALTDVSLEVHPGEIVGLMGPNGAGKTTFIDAITGFVRLHQGSVRLDGVRIDHLKAEKRARLGLGRSFQSLELFDEMSVMENLRAASDRRDSSAYLTELLKPTSAPLPAAAQAAVEIFGLHNDQGRLPSELPYGRRRQLAIARAIAANPSILLLDEPAADLDENETFELGTLIGRLAAEAGIGILLVEHDVHMLNRVCDRIVVIDFGRVLASGTPAEVRENPKVVSAYLGESVGSAELAVER